MNRKYNPRVFKKKITKFNNNANNTYLKLLFLRLEDLVLLILSNITIFIKRR